MIKIIKILCVIVFFLFGKETKAYSPQNPDYIVYKGDTIPIYTLILETYFDKIKKKNEGELFGLKFREGSSFNCWRGYQAFYIVKNDSLFLTDILECGEVYSKEINRVKSKSKLKRIFKKKV